MPSGSAPEYGYAWRSVFISGLVDPPEARQLPFPEQTSADATPRTALKGGEFPSTQGLFLADREGGLKILGLCL